MRIQLMGHGLANQIRMYIFARYGERRCPGETWLFDDSWFYINDIPECQYQLGKVFGLKLNLLSNYFDHATWQEIVRRKMDGACTAQILLDMGMPMILAADWPTYGSFSGTIVDIPGFDPSVVELPYENVYYHGFWAGKKWFQAYEEENRAELSFPELTDAKNKEYASQINNSMSVGIHVRRSGFVPLGWAVPAEWYRPECEKVLDQYPDAKFFIFSDDLPWCRKNAKEMGLDLASQTIYVSGNEEDKKSYIDMQLLSMCKGMIRSRDSSFSQVAGWLNRDLKFEIRFQSLQEKDKSIVAKSFREEEKITKAFFENYEK